MIRPDPCDEGDLDELLVNPAWRLIEQKAAAMLEQERGQCERQENELLLRKAQGAVAALRRVLQLPDIVRQEVRRESPRK